jgi:hypothetical protein
MTHGALSTQACIQMPVHVCTLAACLLLDATLTLPGQRCHNNGLRTCCCKCCQVLLVCDIDAVVPRAACRHTTDNTRLEVSNGNSWVELLYAIEIASGMRPAVPFMPGWRCVPFAHMRLLPHGSCSQYSALNLDSLTRRSALLDMILLQHTCAL